MIETVEAKLLISISLEVVGRAKVLILKINNL